MCGRHGFNCGCGGGCGRTGGRNNNSFPRPNNYNSNCNTNNGKRHMCQVCEKEGHAAIQYWHRYDESYGSEKKMVVVATHSYGVDTNWYTNTGTMDHITGELEKLHMRNKYNGADQVHTASGSGMNICRIGHSVISTPTKDLVLKKYSSCS
jgi:hypothetical protein